MPCGAVTSRSIETQRLGEPWGLGPGWGPAWWEPLWGPAAPGPTVAADEGREPLTAFHSSVSAPVCFLHIWNVRPQWGLPAHSCPVWARGVQTGPQRTLWSPGGDLPSGNLPSAAPSSAQAALPCAVPLLAGSPTRPVMTAVPPTPALDLAKACCRTEIWDCCVFLGASPFIDVNSFLEFLATFPASR